MKYLQELIAQLEAVKELPPGPTNPVGDSDVVVGALDEDHQRLYALRMQNSQQLKKAKKAAKQLEADLYGKDRWTDTDKKRLNEWENSWNCLQARRELLDKLFWASVTATYPMPLSLTGNFYSTLCIGEDWKVYWHSASIGEELLRCIP